MKNRLIIIAFALLFPFLAIAQEQAAKDPKQEMKEFMDFIEKSVEKYQETYDLEDWQCFYVDSIFTHDYLALKEEMESLGKNKVSTPALFVEIQDKWMEQISNSLKTVFTPEQWAKHLKYGEARAQKERAKRRAKRDKI